jgi:hypothetical protein
MAHIAYAPLKGKLCVVHIEMRHGYICTNVAYLCFICASPGSTASTHSYEMKYQEYKGLYYNAWSTNNIVFYNSIRHKATNLLQL